MLYNEYDFDRETGRKKYIKKIVSLFRNSPEYKLWVSYQHRTKKLVCPFTGLDGNIEKDVIELHHHPFTLYEIVEFLLDSIVEKYGEIQKGEHVLNCISSFDVLKII